MHVCEYLSWVEIVRMRTCEYENYLRLTLRLCILIFLNNKQVIVRKQYSMRIGFIVHICEIRFTKGWRKCFADGKWESERECVSDEILGHIFNEWKMKRIPFGCDCETFSSDYWLGADGMRISCSTANKTKTFEKWEINQRAQQHVIMLHFFLRHILI